jgi:hypothetical protein
MRQAKSSRVLFDTAIMEYVAPRLSEIGFRHDKSSFFYKWNKDCFWRIWPFLRESRGIDEGFLHITACVGFRELTQFLARWERGPKDADLSKPCNMAADIIYLRPIIQDPVRISPETDRDHLGIFMWHDIKTFVIPFLDQVGTFDKAFESWKAGRFYNAAGFGTYLLASAYFLRGEKSRALETVQRQIAAEEEQIKFGAAPVGTLNSAEMDVVAHLNVGFDSMGRQEVARLKSFEAFLLGSDPPPTIK